jgi:hypothetical protein
MGLELPGELVSVLALVGRDWPAGDEDKIFEIGQLWTGFADTVADFATTSDALAAEIAQENGGETIDAFIARWYDPTSPAANLRRGVAGATAVGVGLTGIALLVLALKISVITQLVILAIQVAQAVMSAGPTFGLSLAEIPLLKMITSLAIDQLVDAVLNALLAGD